MRWSHGWNVIAVALVFQAISYGTILSSFALFMPLWSTEFGITHSMATLYLTASVLLSGLVGAVAGKALDRFPVKLVILVGAAAYIASFFILSIIKTPLQLFLVYSIILPIGLVLLGSLPSQVLVARWFGQKSSVQLGIVLTGVAMGGVIMPPIVGQLIAATGGWRGACQILAATMGIAVVPLILLVVRDGPFARAGVEGEATAANSTHPVKMARDTTLFRDKRFVWAILASLPLWTTYSGFQTNLGPLSMSKGTDLTLVSIELALLNGSAFIATSSAGWLLTRIHHRHLYRIIAALSTTGALTFFFSSGPVGMMIASVLIGLGTGATGSIIASYFCLAFGAARMGTSMGTTLMISRIGILGPPMFAFMNEHTGSYTAPLMTLAALGIISILCSSQMPKVEPASD